MAVTGHPRHLQVRQDTAANWASANPVLRVGEPGYETDTRLLKIGDGVTAWTSLTYAGLSHTIKPNRYYCWSEGGTPATNIFGEADLYFTPLLVPHRIKVARLGILVNIAGSAGAVLRFGIYRDGGAGLPGALLVDGGTVDATGTGWKEVTLSPEQYLTPGPWWLAFVTQGGAGTRPTVYRIPNWMTYKVPQSYGTAAWADSTHPPTGSGGAGSFRAAGVSGALPATAPVPDDSSVNSPAILYLTSTSFA